MSAVYKTWNNIFSFNDPVEIGSINFPLEERTGRLIQVRKKCGAYGSDFLLIRTANGVLRFFENCSINYYTAAELPIDPDDFDGEEYLYVGGIWPETGFLIERPKQPESDSPPFAITIHRTTLPPLRAAAGVASS